MDEFDEQLIQDVMDALEDRLTVTGLEISGNGGSIILSGTVPTEAERRTAERVAGNIPGVRYVRNELQVRNTTASGITEQHVKSVRDALDSDPDLAREDIAVSTEEGMLVVEGTVTTLRKKRKITSLLQNMQGTPEYSLRLVAVPEKSMSDEILAAGVLRELVRHKRIMLNSLDISVENGAVTLSGFVPSFTVKTAVYETALTTPGVREVRDRIEVTPPF